MAKNNILLYLVLAVLAVAVVYLLSRATLPQSQPVYNTTTVSTSSSSTTTTTIASTTSSSTSTTTTVSSATTNIAKVFALLKTSDYYGMMLNYTNLYANTNQCTPNSYNSAYATYRKSYPAGPNSYANVSAIVPYNMTLNITNTTSTNYIATFITKSHTPSVTGGPAIAIAVDLAKNQVTGTTVEGAYYGLSYSNLRDGLDTAMGIGSPCAILIASTG